MNSSAPEIPVQPDPLEYGLPNLATAIAGTDAVKIVALGSSTTEGEGGIVAFPYRLEAELRQTYQDRHPNQRRMIDVINRGIGGEEAPMEFKRMDRDVIAEKPCLVIWQIGTNAVWQKDADTPSAEETIRALREGVDRLLQSGKIDIILMDLQYAPAMLTPELSDATDAMVSAIAEVASDKKVNLFRRFKLMKAWHELEHVSFDTMVDPTDENRLHDSDWTTQKLVWILNKIMWDAIDKAEAS
jgi:GDSL-like Lipase/Acylhydrolase family